ncbi:MAG: glycosyltransferase [Acidimicrobiales bacterium]
MIDRAERSPCVRVGIVSWNTADHLEACLAALPAALGEVAAEVVVVDNASSDESVAVARRHGVSVVANDRNLGYAVAMNQALAGSAAPLLLALNPDTVPGPGTLAQLVGSAERHPAAGVLVPRLVGVSGRPQPSALRFPGAFVPIVATLSTPRLRRSRLGRHLLLEGSGPHAGGRVDWAIGAVHLIRAAALQGEVPYSERSFMYAEDLDLCWRLDQRGAPTVLIPEVTIEHVGNVAGAQAWGDVRSLRYWAATYDVIAQRRSPGAARRVAAGCCIGALLSVLRSAPKAVAGSPSARRVVRQRRRELGIHARALLLGPPAPPRTPPG